MKTITMNKRGSEVAINPLITIALGVIVLIILIVIFRDQITKGGKSYTDIASQASTDENACSFIKSRTCRAAPCPTHEKEIIASTPNCGKKIILTNGETREVNQICCGNPSNP